MPAASTVCGRCGVKVIPWRGAWKHANGGNSGLVWSCGLPPAPVARKHLHEANHDDA